MGSYSRRFSSRGSGLAGQGSLRYEPTSLIICARPVPSRATGGPRPRQAVFQCKDDPEEDWANQGASAQPDKHLDLRLWELRRSPSPEPEELEDSMRAQVAIF